MLALPSTIRTIYRDAFADLGGEWQVDWSGMDALSYIGSGAFRDSGIAGDVKIDAHGEDLAIGHAAFGGCAQLTSLGIENALSLDIGNEAFADCATLERVTLDTLAEAGGDAGNLGTNVFTSGPAFKLLEFTSSAPLQLNLYSPGIAWSIGEPAEDAEESADVRIKVPAGSEENYLSSWVYALAGYANHDDYFAAVQFSLIDWDTFEMPTAEALDEAINGPLMVQENRLRAMLGLPQIASTDELAYAYDVSTLVG